jgi:hypothetical protein
MKELNPKAVFAAELTVKLIPHCFGGTPGVKLQEAIRLARKIMVAFFGEDWNKDEEDNNK